MSRATELGNKLYRGEVSYPIVGRQRLWYTISGVILLLSLVVLFLPGRGLNFGIEFRGGAEFRFTSATAQEGQIRDVVEEAGVTGEQRIIKEGTDTWRVQTGALTTAEGAKVRTALSEAFDVPEVNSQSIGPTWGADVSKKAGQALAVFLALILLYLSFTFEWKMAIAALVALLHDLLITIGIYALVGFEVTPASVIGLLTILGYSLYDTVVVFDKVDENTKGITGGSRHTYSEAANLALNQTLVRSVNTSIIALLPIGSILFIASFLLGAGTLKDLSLALFVGVAAGTYSSVFIATPLLADLKEREPAMAALRKRVQARRGGPAKDRTGPAGPATEPGGVRPDAGAPSAPNSGQIPDARAPGAGTVLADDDTDAETDTETETETQQEPLSAGTPGGRRPRPPSERPNQRRGGPRPRPSGRKRR
jgi:preprotein translocase subunit SecF